jgi:hypothetical protein
MAGRNGIIAHQAVKRSKSTPYAASRRSLSEYWESSAKHFLEKTETGSPPRVFAATAIALVVKQGVFEVFVEYTKLRQGIDTKGGLLSWLREKTLKCSLSSLAKKEQ